MEELDVDVISLLVCNKQVEFCHWFKLIQFRRNVVPGPFGEIGECDEGAEYAEEDG